MKGREMEALRGSHQKSALPSGCPAPRGIHFLLHLRILKMPGDPGGPEARLSPAVLCVPLGDPRREAFYDSRPHKWETVPGSCVAAGKGPGLCV